MGAVASVRLVRFSAAHALNSCSGHLQFSIDETLEYNLNLVDGGVLGAQTVSQQLKAINASLLPYTCAPVGSRLQYFR